MVRERLRIAIRNAGALQKIAALEPLSWLERQRLKIKLGLNPFTTWVSEDQPHYLMSHAYPETRRVHIAEDTPAAIEAHELGHITHKDNPLESALLGMGGFATIGNILPSLMVASTDPHSPYSKYAPALGGVLALPKLINEAIASYRGAKALKEIRPDEPLLPLIMAQLTYPLGTLPLSMGAPYLLRKQKLKALKGGDKNE